MMRVMSAELLKIRKKMVWFLVVLGPLGVIGLQAVNFGLRYDYLTKQYADDLWGGLIGNVAMLMVPTLFMGLAILASMTAGIEHQTNAWKQTLALPISRAQVFAGKFLLSVLLLFCSSTLLVAGTIGLGAALGFDPGTVPYAKLLELIYYPYLAIMPFIALQVWMSVMMHNQAIPLTVGIVGTVFSMFSTRFEDWMPYKWPYLINAADNPLYSVAAGVATGIVVLAAGTLNFVRKDVK
ncbi:ABC transporter permease [Paenibacillus spongiae]|uniref:ABC transporter permease n=1 Tax=Paenibacillus spongiae TaxID=2909671 RepID=A0ABY5SNN5_9BACL|nr:ABC transporter permease [Paenibacillus spongiae]UVI33823.1 ABC transporter permease [Paenibacillus spongiae]